MIAAAVAAGAASGCAGCVLPVIPRTAADGGGAAGGVNVSVWGNNGTKGTDDNGGMSAVAAHVAGAAVKPVMGFETWCLRRGE